MKIVSKIIEELKKAKYIKREGVPGNYKYTYKEEVSPDVKDNKESEKGFRHELATEHHLRKYVVHSLEAENQHRQEQHDEEDKHKKTANKHYKMAQQHSKRAGLSKEEFGNRIKDTVRNIKPFHYPKTSEFDPHPLDKELKKSFDDYIVNELEKGKSSTFHKFPMQPGGKIRNKKTKEDNKAELKQKKKALAEAGINKETKGEY